MNFNSGIFLIFLPVVILGFWLVPHKFRKYWLLAASYFFYMYWNPWLIILLLISTTIDYLCGMGMQKFDDSPAKRKLLLGVSVCMNLGLLFSFKYLDFLSININNLLSLTNTAFRLPLWNLILPVGISFYTFQTMSYSIDVYRREVEPEKDFFTFALYVSYFPQLVAGPIENPKNLIPQLKNQQKLSAEDLTIGFRLLLVGFFRKCVVADTCGIYVNSVFDNLDTANSTAVVIAALLFCMQIYCDFAGYSLIAAGSARLMGVKLMKNFDRPYTSTSVTEFYRRWHISLNQWFTKYVYFPLGGSRKGLACRLRNSLIVFALCGIWHGARWTYVLWGLYAGVLVCIESLLRKPAEKMHQRLHIDTAHPLYILFRRTIIFVLYIPSAIVFRAVSLTEAVEAFKKLFAFNWNFTAGIATAGLNAGLILEILLIIIVMALLSNWEEYTLTPAENETLSARQIVSYATVFIIIALAWLSLLATQDVSTFAYFQF